MHFHKLINKINHYSSPLHLTDTDSLVEATEDDIYHPSQKSSSADSQEEIPSQEEKVSWHLIYFLTYT